MAYRSPCSVEGSRVPMERPAPQQIQEELHSTCYLFDPGERPVHPMGAESISNVRHSESLSEGHYIPGLYEHRPVMVPQDTSAPLLEVQMHLAQRDDVQELRARICELHLARDGERGAYQCENMCGHQEYIDTDVLGSDCTPAEVSVRRRALSLPVQQWHRRGVAGAQEDDTHLLCCCKLKKKVQFADSLGLCLASVKHFLPSEEPLVPPSVLARLQSYPPTVSLQRAQLSLNTENEPDQPVAQELRAKVEVQGVCLEQASDTQWGVRGVVLVRESEEFVQVKVRYTFNDWLSHLDCPASALPAPGPQRFLFTLCYPPATARVQFAICCNFGNGQELWDNNQGLNYSVCCHQEPLPDLQASHMEQEESCTDLHW